MGPLQRKKALPPIKAGGLSSRQNNPLVRRGIGGDKETRRKVLY